MWLTATNVLLAMEPTQRAVLLQSTAAQCCYRVQRASQEWKRRRCYRVAAGSGSAATEHTTGSGSAATEHAGQERCELFLYLDYHGVLDTGVPDMLEAMRRFLIRVDHIKRLNLHHMTDMHPDIYVTLLSKEVGGNETESAHWMKSPVLGCFTCSTVLCSQANEQAMTMQDGLLQSTIVTVSMNSRRSMSFTMEEKMTSFIASMVSAASTALCSWMTSLQLWRQCVQHPVGGDTRHPLVASK